MVKDQYNQLGGKVFGQQIKVITFGVNPLIHGLFLGTDVSPFPNFNNSVLTTRRNLLLHC